MPSSPWGRARREGDDAEARLERRVRPAINQIIHSKSPIQFGEYFRNVRIANPNQKMKLNDVSDI